MALGSHISGNRGSISVERHLWLHRLNETYYETVVKIYKSEKKIGEKKKDRETKILIVRIDFNPKITIKVISSPIIIFYNYRWRNDFLILLKTIDKLTIFFVKDLYPRKYIIYFHFLKIFFIETASLWWFWYRISQWLDMHSPRGHHVSPWTSC